MTKRRVVANGTHFSYQWKFLCFWINGYSVFGNKNAAQSFVNRMNEQELREKGKWKPIE